VFDFLNEAARRVLRGRAAKPATPQYDINDPRHPINACDGWQRADIPEGRRVRFRFAVGDHLRQIPTAPPITGAGFISGGGGHVEQHADAPKQVARPVPPRTGVPTAPRADTFWTRVR